MSMPKVTSLMTGIMNKISKKASSIDDKVFQMFLLTIYFNPIFLLYSLFPQMNWHLPSYIQIISSWQTASFLRVGNVLFGFYNPSIVPYT